MKKKLSSKEEFKIMQDFERKWRKVIMYAAVNGFEVPKLMEELASVYHLDDHTKEIKKQAKSEREIVDQIFVTLYTHGDWDTKNALNEALIHAHMGLLHKQGKLTLEEEKRLKLKCGECSKCVCCGDKVNKETARFITNNEFCERFCEGKGDVIMHRKGCRYFGR